MRAKTTTKSIFFLTLFLFTSFVSISLFSPNAFKIKIGDFD